MGCRILYLHSHTHTTLRVVLVGIFCGFFGDDDENELDEESFFLKRRPTSGLFLSSSSQPKQKSIHGESLAPLPSPKRT